MLMCYSHVQLMAIGGSIGTALFVGIGGSLKNAGPLSVLLGYLFWGLLFIWPSYLLVAEMLAWLPIRGTIFELGGRYVDPALGFAMGWTYFFAGAMLVCTEYAAVATVMSFWNTGVNAAVWVTMALVICVFLNLVAVRCVLLCCAHKVLFNSNHRVTDGTANPSSSWLQRKSSLLSA